MICRGYWIAGLALLVLAMPGSAEKVQVKPQAKEPGFTHVVIFQLKKEDL